MLTFANLRIAFVSSSSCGAAVKSVGVHNVTINGSNETGLQRVATVAGEQPGSGSSPASHYTNHQSVRQYTVLQIQRWKILFKYLGLIFEFQ